MSSARKNSQMLAGNFSNDRNASSRRCPPMSLLQNPHADTNSFLNVKKREPPSRVLAFFRFVLTTVRWSSPNLALGIRMSRHSGRWFLFFFVVVALKCLSEVNHYWSYKCMLMSHQFAPIFAAMVIFRETGNIPLFDDLDNHIGSVRCFEWFIVHF